MKGYYYMSQRLLLSTDQQIEHCKSKGITFNLYTEENAKNHLTDYNTFFRIRSYRKNFSKNNKNKYINLDFAYLIDLSIIDHELRRTLLNMALNVEHTLKLNILNSINNTNLEDGYTIVKTFLSTYPDVEKSLKLQKRTPYTTDLYTKFQKISLMPIWAILELLSFSQLILLAKYTAIYTRNNELNKIANQLYDIKELRNACAHDNCIINDLKNKERTHKPSYIVTSALGKLNISPNSRKNKLNNVRIYQITTLLLFHNRFLKSREIRRKVANDLLHLKTRLYRNHDYKTNNVISSFFDYLIKLIDNWYRAD